MFPSSCQHRSDLTRQTSGPDGSGGSSNSGQCQDCQRKGKTPGLYLALLLGRRGRGLALIRDRSGKTRPRSSTSLCYTASQEAVSSVTQRVDSRSPGQRHQEHHLVRTPPNGARFRSGQSEENDSPAGSGSAATDNPQELPRKPCRGPKRHGKSPIKRTRATASQGKATSTGVQASPVTGSQKTLHTMWEESCP